MGILNSIRRRQMVIAGQQLDYAKDQLNRIKERRKVLQDKLRAKEIDRQEFNEKLENLKKREDKHKETIKNLNTVGERGRGRPRKEAPAPEIQKRGRGRPRKEAPAPEIQEIQKRGRGRPRKEAPAPETQEIQKRGRGRPSLGLERKSIKERINSLKNSIQKYKGRVTALRAAMSDIDAAAKEKRAAIIQLKGKLSPEDRQKLADQRLKMKQRYADRIAAIKDIIAKKTTTLERISQG